MRIAVIGGGPAGMMAAGTAASLGAEVTLFEKNEKLGKKLYITGKGRCNVTNVDEGDAFMRNIVTNPRFMYSAMSEFSSSDTISLIERMGIALKTERGGRVFPISDKASDITKAFERYMNDGGVKVRLDSTVERIITDENGFSAVIVNGIEHRFDACIIATGGVSYPTTGSTGDGYRFAKQAGLNVIKPRQALCGIYTHKVWPLMGLTLKNVNVTLFDKNKKIRSEFGELLFTHMGISGPTVLTLSSFANKLELKDTYVSIDLKPALTEEELDKRFLRDFEQYKNKQLKNALVDLLPSNMIPVMTEYAGVSGEIAVNSVTKAQRLALVRAFKDFRHKVKALEPIEHAVVTSGGVDVKEINASNMQCKKVKNLYFAGEVIDIDALTGGYNIQLALSTGYLAGKSAVYALFE